MFVIELTYKAPLADIDASMPAHVTFLKKYYAAGNFLVSDRKIPRDGGIILAAGDSRQRIEAIAREDPCASPYFDHAPLAMRTPSAMASSFPHMIDGCTPRMIFSCAKPQSVTAITF